MTVEMSPGNKHKGNHQHPDLAACNRQLTYDQRQSDQAVIARKMLAGEQDKGRVRQLRGEFGWRGGGEDEIAEQRGSPCSSASWEGPC